MRPIRISVTGIAYSNVIPVDNYISPTNWGIALVVGSGNSTYLFYTFDDVWAKNFDPSTATWFYHPSTPSGTPATANTVTNVAYPCTGIRMQNSAGTATTTMTIIQAGGGGNA